MGGFASLKLIKRVLNVKEVVRRRNMGEGKKMCLSMGGRVRTSIDKCVYKLRVFGGRSNKYKIYIYNPNYDLWLVHR